MAAPLGAWSLSPPEGVSPGLGGLGETVAGTSPGEMGLFPTSCSMGLELGVPWLPASPFPGERGVPEQRRPGGMGRTNLGTAGMVT